MLHVRFHNNVSNPALAADFRINATERKNLSEKNFPDAWRHPELGWLRYLERHEHIGAHAAAYRRSQKLHVGELSADIFRYHEASG